MFREDFEGLPTGGKMLPDALERCDFPPMIGKTPKRRLWEFLISL